MLSVSQLFIYPIKSFAGISLTSAEVTDRGLKHDRRWMLVNEHNQFMTQRTLPSLALFQVFVENDNLIVKHKKNESKISVPFQSIGNKCNLEIWTDVCEGIEVSMQVSEWFSDMLSLKCKLVYMPESTKRKVDKRYANNDEITSFSDAYPFLILGQSSLDDLNNKLEETLPINRFRPNIVFKGGISYEEDGWADFNINRINFYGVKLCARCVVTTIDQNEATQGKEPLRTLATYRTFNNKICFGQNLVHIGKGNINVGDTIEVKERKPSAPFVKSTA